MSESPQAVIMSGGMNGDKSRVEARGARYRNEAGSSKGFDETIMGGEPLESFDHKSSISQPGF